MQSNPATENMQEADDKDSKIAGDILFSIPVTQV